MLHRDFGQRGQENVTESILCDSAYTRKARWAMNLREVREAAELHREGIKADIDVVVDYAIATIDPSPDEPITADWLREVWGFEKVDWSSRTYENGHAAMICWGDYWNYEDDDLNWPHNLTTRQQFCDLAIALGITRKDGAK